MLIGRAVARALVATAPDVGRAGLRRTAVDLILHC